MDDKLRRPGGPGSILTRYVHIQLTPWLSASVLTLLLQSLWCVLPPACSLREDISVVFDTPDDERKQGRHGVRDDVFCMMNWRIAWFDPGSRSLMASGGHTWPSQGDLLERHTRSFTQPF